MTRPTALAAVAAALAFGGCGGGTGALEVRRPLVGEAPEGADAAVYFEIETEAADALVGAESPAADSASLHELELVGGGGVMWPAERIALERGGVTRLEPMGSHVMLHRLHRDLAAGDRVEIALDFEHHPTLVVEAEVVPLYELAELAGSDR